MTTAASPYHLTTARLGFGRWHRDDFGMAWSLWGEPAVTRFVGGPFSVARVRERLDREVLRGEQYGVQYWPLFLLESGEHIGCCGLKPERPTEGLWETGFYLKPPYWGQRYGLEAFTRVLAYAFDDLNATALQAGHHPHNEASKGLLTKLGFEYLHEEDFAPTGIRHHLTGLTRERYFELRVATLANESAG